jgi:hypothetical protein
MADENTENILNPEIVDGTQTGEVIPPQDNTPTEDGQNIEPASTEATQPVTTDATVPTEPASTAPTDTPEVLKKQLEEYQLRDKELAELQQRLGVNYQNPASIQAMQQREILDNQIQQNYIQVCNKFGIDYNPDKIEASANELRTKDPQSYYDFRLALDSLENIANTKRNEIDTYIRNIELQTALASKKQVLDASPAINAIINQSIEQGIIQNPNTDIDAILNLVMPAYKEAFEAGRLIERQGKAQSVPPAQVLNNSVMAGNASSLQGQPGEHIFTADEIRNMSYKDYQKNQKAIDSQAIRGLIQ